MIATYTSLAVLLGTCVAVGSALHAVLRLPELSWLAPVSGLSVLLILTPIVVRVPGHGIAGAVALVVLFMCSVLLLGRRRLVPPLAAAVTPALIVAALEALPFVANWRFGPLGVGINDDLGPHFAWSDALRTGNDRLFDSIFPGYPIGPHSVAASLGGLLGINAVGPFTAILLAAPILTAVASLELLRALPSGRRIAGAVSAGLPYLAVAYFAQGAFKEPLMGLLLVSFALVFQRALLDPGRPMAHGVVLGLHVAAAVSVYSFPGAYPFVGGAFAALALALIVRGGRVAGRAKRDLFAGGAVAIGVLVVTLLPQLGRLMSFAPADLVGGNFIGKISGYEVFGIWKSGDFRLFPPDVFYAGILAAFAAAVAVYGGIWWLAERQVALPATAGATLVIWSVANTTEPPYLSAKVLVMATPTVVLLGLSALLYGIDVAPKLASFAHGVLAAVFIASALSSSILVLRNANVGPSAHTDELAKLRPFIRGESTLFLGQDDFAAWELRDSLTSFAWVYLIQSMIPLELRPEKPFAEGMAFDFDSVKPDSLNAFRYVITTSTGFASEPPENWRLVTRTRSFILWRRYGQTAARRILTETGAPGALFDCTTPEGRQLRRRGFLAAVRPQPAVSTTPWTIAGVPAQQDGLGFAQVPLGQRAERSLDLPAGSWEVSLQYISPTSLRVESPGFSASLPATLDRRGPYWPVGRLESDGGSVTVAVEADETKLDLASRRALLGQMVAIPSGTKARLIPMREACGLYVDWYR